MGWQPPGAPPPYPTYHQGPAPPRTRRRIPPATTCTPKGPPGPYLLSGPTQATRPGPANGGAPAPPPARRTHPRRSRSPHRHSASTTHSRRSCSPRRHHGPLGPRSRRSRSPRRHHARHRRPMATSCSPHKPNRASRSPLRPYGTPTSSLRHHRSRSPRRRHAHHCRPMSTTPSPNRPHPASCFPPSPVPVLHPKPPPPPLLLPQVPPRPPPPHVHVLLPPLRDLELGPLPPPGPRPPRLVVCPRLARAPPLGEVGWVSGKARRGAHGTPANPNEAAPEAIMPQAACEALLRDAVQDLRPPLHPPNPPQMAPGHPLPGLGHRSPPPTPPPPHREGKGHVQGEGNGQRGTLR